MEIKTTNEIFAYADSIPDDARYDELHEKYLDEQWVRVSDIKKYLYWYKENVDDYHSSDFYVKKFIDELSQGDKNGN